MPSAMGLPVRVRAALQVHSHWSRRSFSALPACPQRAGPMGWQRMAVWDMLWSPSQTALKAAGERLRPGQVCVCVSVCACVRTFVFACAGSLTFYQAHMPLACLTTIPPVCFHALSAGHQHGAWHIRCEQEESAATDPSHRAGAAASAAVRASDLQLTCRPASVV